ncbi:MAG: Gamma-DL-glutamyl hydrolase precursor [Bacteroidetes bacterium ADurb.Bin408]|nr:MAG: Gamma-DL-glutamyl hydrolase precursor [Bacteroidetes bacterium ADurb.Bin408]
MTAKPFFVFIFIFSFKLSFSCVQISGTGDTLKTDTISKINYDQLIDSIIFYAEKYLGTRYRAGGHNKNGFDCSGFTSYVFANFGIDIPRSSRDQALKGLPLDFNDIKRGDLLFFKGRNRNSNIVGHVGLVIERNDTTIRFIHASRNKGICYDYTTSDYYSARYIGAKRLLGDNITDSLWPGFNISDTLITDTLDDVQTDSVEPVINNYTHSKNETPPKNEAKKTDIHHVKKGDTLYSIAKNNHTTVEKIIALNNLKSDKIYPGQKLKLK